MTRAFMDIFDFFLLLLPWLYEYKWFLHVLLWYSLNFNKLTLRNWKNFGISWVIKRFSWKGCVLKWDFQSKNYEGFHFWFIFHSFHLKNTRFLKCFFDWEQLKISLPFHFHKKFYIIHQIFPLIYDFQQNLI